MTSNSSLSHAHENDGSDHIIHHDYVNMEGHVINQQQLAPPVFDLTQMEDPMLVYSTTTKKTGPAVALPGPLAAAAALPATGAAARKEADPADDQSHVSTESADGIYDVPGFLCICCVILIGDMSRGVFFPCMWPLVQQLGGSEITLGYAVASFSLGRVLVNPLFGSWAHTLGYTQTLHISCSILLLGTLLFAHVESVGTPAFLIVAQTVLGIGSGTLGVTRAFVAEVTAQRHRTKYMGLLTAVQYGGFTVTPIFGSLFTHVLGDGNWRWLGGWVRINRFTAPAYFMSSIVLFTILMLVLYFRDRTYHHHHQQQQQQHREEQATAAADAPSRDEEDLLEHEHPPRVQAPGPDLENRHQEPQKPAPKRPSQLMVTEVEVTANTVWPWCCGLTTYDCCILGCMLLNIATKGSIAAFETMGIAIAQQRFALTDARAGVVVACCGALGVVALLSMGVLERWAGGDIGLITGGMLVMATGIASLSNPADELAAAHGAGRYWLAMLLIYAVGYPIGHTAVIGIFSKIVGRRPQGTLLGWFASAGSLARMIFPITSGYITKYYDFNVLFGVLVIVLLISTVFVILSRRTLSLLST